MRRSRRSRPPGTARDRGGTTGEVPFERSGTECGQPVVVVDQADALALADAGGFLLQLDVAHEPHDEDIGRAYACRDDAQDALRLAVALVDGGARRRSRGVLLRDDNGLEYLQGALLVLFREVVEELVGQGVAPDGSRDANWE